MMDAAYYREQAARARRFAGDVPAHPEVQRQLLDMAQDYGDIADDLEAGAIAIRHPERMPQLRR